MASEYIEREAVYDTLTEYYHHKTDTQHGALREALSRVPATDVAPVRRGRWIVERDDYFGFQSVEIKCSECNSHPTSGKMTSFCPNCGADMRGVDRQ